MGCCCCGRCRRLPTFNQPLRMARTSFTILRHTHNTNETTSQFADTRRPLRRDNHAAAFWLLLRTPTTPTAAGLVSVHMWPAAAAPVCSAVAVQSTRQAVSQAACDSLLLLPFGRYEAAFGLWCVQQRCGVNITTIVVNVWLVRIDLHTKHSMAALAGCQPALQSMGSTSPL